MHYPGTVIEYNGVSGRDFLDGIFLATSGLVMRQVCEISGLNTPTIQNWVSRKFIAHPIDRKYDKDATARILLINALRNTLSLEEIKKLLNYVNGSPENDKDDIIPESELYSFACDIRFSKNQRHPEKDNLKNRVIFEEKISGSKERLEKALDIISLSLLAEKALNAARDFIRKLPNSNILGEKMED